MADKVDGYLQFFKYLIRCAVEVHLTKLSSPPAILETPPNTTISMVSISNPSCGSSEELLEDYIQLQKDLKQTAELRFREMSKWIAKKNKGTEKTAQLSASAIEEGQQSLYESLDALKTRKRTVKLSDVQNLMDRHKLLWDMGGYGLQGVDFGEK
ncbi:hypothetical protein BDQ12DRAFT_660864 [Crucibulum laeve]|uniref:Uncharacterized protein n=1 Tax=Crucibulum laeve TaxID=68775 RepID=A0A5C3MF44_9AGAR|nr:hypothetical protein BDQ12DRAFT_660864 [Crucibulum laeve]